MENTRRLTRTALAVALTVLIGVLAAPSYAQAPPIVLNFDSVDASAGAVDATSYFTSIGATLSDVTLGTSVQIINNKNLYGGQAAVPTSAPNLIQQSGTAGCGPVSFRLVLATSATAYSVASVSFNRAMLLAGPSGVIHPAWSAHALDSSGTEVATVGEPLIASFSNVPPQPFTLTGPDIRSVRFDSNCMGIAGFSGALIDDLILQP